ncbi:MAG: pectinesterase family protein, partial [Bacteroidia bacterium]
MKPAYPSAFLAKLTNFSRLIIKVFATLFFISTFSFSGFAQLSGSYSIGSSNAHYASIKNAIADLQKNGVNGPVTFNIQAGTFYESIEIDGTPNGVSSTNTITFKGASKFGSSIKYSSAVYLSNADYIQIQDLKLFGTDYVVDLEIASNCSVKNCKVFSNRYTEDDDVGGIRVRYSSNNNIENNLIKGGYYGIYEYGSSNSYYKGGNRFSKNYITLSYRCGFYNEKSFATSFEYNYIDSLRMDDYQMVRFYNCAKSTINANQLHFTYQGGTGLYIYDENTSPSTNSYITVISNNYINAYDSKRSTGAFLINCDRNRFINNTVIGNGAQSTAYALRVSGGGENAIFNNNLYQLHINGYTIHITSPSTVDSLDYNNLWAGNSNKFAYIQSDRSSLAALKSYGNSYGFSQNSISEELNVSEFDNPNFETPELNNVGYRWAGIAADINKNSRPTGPDTKIDIGCNDYYLTSNDAGISNVEHSTLCKDKISFQAGLYNFGTASLSSCSLHYAHSVNGQSYSSTISKAISSQLTSNSDTLIDLGTVSFQNANYVTFKVWTSAPNGNSDGKAANDTFYFRVEKGFEGRFTVASKNADFTSINAALSALANKGICGPVTLKLTDHLYNEHFVIEQIPGISQSNSLSIVGLGKNKTHISHAVTSTTNMATITLNGADYVSIDSLTVSNKSSVNGAGILLYNSSNHNTFKNCRIVLDSASQSSDYRSAGFAISKTEYDFIEDFGGEFNELHNCEIRGGTFGYFADAGAFENAPESNNVIGCNFYNQIEYALFSNYGINRKILNNRVDSTDYSLGGTVVTSFGVSDSIAGNKVASYQNSAAWVFLYSNYNVNDTSYFVNNQISGGKSSGLNAVSNNNTLYLNNSLYSDNDYTASFSSDIGSKWLNNTFQNESGYAIKLSSTSGIANGAVDYNNYFTNGRYMAYVSRNVRSLADWKIYMSGINANSINEAVNYPDKNNLNSQSPLLNNKGINLPRFKHDIDENLRPANDDTNFDIGAYEYYLGTHDLDITYIDINGTKTINIELRNNGLNVLNDTAYITIEIDSVTFKDTIYLVGFNSGKDSTISIGHNYNFVANSNIKLCASIDNGIRNDPDLDDSFCKNQCIGVGGTYTIGKSANADFSSFNAAIDFVGNCGVIDTVIFNVEAGTYIEKIKLLAIKGAGQNTPIIFNGTSNRNDVVITSYANSTNELATVLLEGANYITFNNMTITATGPTYGNAFRFCESANYNTINNCILRVNDQINSGYLTPVNFSHDPAKSNYGDNGNYNQITNNKIIGGAFGVAIRGETFDSHSAGNNIINNIFRNQFVYAILTEFNRDNTISQNDIDSITYYLGYGISSSFCFNQTINANRVKATFRAISLLNSNNSYGNLSDTSFILNNIISIDNNNHFTNGIFTSGANKIYIVGNSLYSQNNNDSTLTSLLNLNSGSDFLIFNNSVSNAYNGYVLYTNQISGLQSDHNNWHYQSTTKNAFQINGTTYGTLSQLQASTSLDANSISVNPKYSLYNFYTKGTDLNNKGKKLTRFNSDFAGEKRPIGNDPNFDIGAIEFSVEDYDADIIGIVPSKFVVGSNTISIAIKNNGAKAWNNNDTLYLQYAINGGANKKQSFICGIVAAGDTATYTFTNSETIGNLASLEICANFYKRFKQQDPDKLNEEYCAIQCVSGKALVIVDALGNGDFRTINEAIDHFECTGISSPSIIRVRPGVYTEQVEINHISGLSSTNSLTIVGSGKHNTTLTNANNELEYSTLLLNGSNHIVIDSLNVVSTCKHNAMAVRLTNSADSNIIKNSRFSTPITDGYGYYYTIAFSGKSPKILSKIEGNNGNNNHIENNEIIGGSYGILLSGVFGDQIEGNTIKNNVIKHQNQRGVLAQYTYQIIIDQNKIDSLLGYAYAIEVRNSEKVSVLSNTITNVTTGIYFVSVNSGSSTDTSYVVNNSIEASEYYGIQNSYSKNVMYLHNSVKCTNCKSAFYLNSLDKPTITNNIFENTGGDYLSYVNVTNLANLAIDYNNYFESSVTTPFYHNGNTYTNLAAYKNGYKLQNRNSLTHNPEFVKSPYLLPTNLALNSKGKNSITWPTDIINQSRPISPDFVVDMGAAEFNIPGYKATITSIDTLDFISIGKNTIGITIKNTGANNLTGEDIVVSYLVDGIKLATDTIACKFLMPESDTVYYFTKTWNNNNTGYFNVCAQIDTILGRNTDIGSSLCFGACTGSKDTIVVDHNGNGDFTTITEAIKTVECGITGSVVVLIKNGTYNETVYINSIKGLSNQNTLKIIGESKKGVFWNNVNDNNVLVIDNAENIRVENITITNTYAQTNYGGVIGIKNGSKNIRIKNCDLINPVPTFGDASIKIGSNAGTNCNLKNPSGIEILNCNITGGNYGIYIRSTCSLDVDTGFTIKNCNIYNTNRYGIYAENVGSISISNTNIDSLVASAPYGLYFDNIKNAAVNACRITSLGTGIFVTNDYNFRAADSSYFTNNVISAGQYGIRTTHAPYYLYYHNTIASYGPIQYALIDLTGHIDGIQIKNNNFYSTNALFIRSSVLDANALDYNNYYATNQFKTSLGSSQFRDFALWKASSYIYNQHSIAVDPSFSNSNYDYANASELINAGEPLGVKYDIHGTFRNQIAPDIGANEVSRDLYVKSIRNPNTACKSIGNKDSLQMVISSVGQGVFVNGDSLFVGFEFEQNTFYDTLIVSTNTKISNGEVHFNFDSLIQITNYGGQSLRAWVKSSRDREPSNDTLLYQFTIKPNPTAAFTVAEVCEYDSSHFIDASTLANGAITNWYWSFGNGQSSALNNPKHFYQQADTFSTKLTITTDQGCRDSIIKTTIVHPAPIASFNVNDACQGQSIAFVNNSTIGSGSLSYTWSFDDGNGSNTKNPQHSYSNAGNYNPKLIAISGLGCSDSANESLTIYVQPQSSFIAKDVCLGDSTIFTNSTDTSSGAIKSAWNFGDGTTSINYNNTHLYDSVKIYTAQLISTNKNFACADTITKTITVNPNPTAAFNALSACLGDSIAFTNTSNGTSLSSYWTFDDGNSSINSNPKHLYKNSGVYDVSLLVTDQNGCKDSTELGIGSTTKAHADFTTINACVHDSAEFVYASSVTCSPVSKYIWNYGDGTIDTISSQRMPRHQYATSGIYNVKLTLLLPDNSTSSNTKSVAVYAQPAASFTNTASCEGNLMQFTNTTTAQSSTTLKGFSWTFGDGGTATLKNPTNTYSNSGTYNVRMIVTDSRNCSDTTLKSLTVSPNPSANFSYTNACAYDTVKFTNSSTVSTGSVTGFAWDFGNNTTANTRHTGNVYGTSGYYQVKMVAESDAGCKDSVTKTVQAFTIPS